jgi:hypothetical protein
MSVNIILNSRFNPEHRAALYPGTSDLINLLQRFDLDGVASGALCKYAKIALDRGFIRVSATVPVSQVGGLYQSTHVAAEVTDAGRCWMENRLGTISPDAGTA